MSEVVIINQSSSVVTTDQSMSVVTQPHYSGIIVTSGLQGPRGLPGKDAQAYSTISSVSLSGQRLLYLNSSGVLDYASNQVALSANRVLGISLGAVMPGNVVDIINNQEFIEPSWNWDVTKPIYLGTLGQLTQVEPETPLALFSLLVAFPVSPTKIFIRIQTPIFLQ